MNEKLLTCRVTGDLSRDVLLGPDHPLLSLLHLTLLSLVRLRDLLLLLLSIHLVTTKNPHRTQKSELEENRVGHKITTRLLKKICLSLSVYHVSLPSTASVSRSSSHHPRFFTKTSVVCELRAKNARRALPLRTPLRGLVVGARGGYFERV
jgi:hypothetical protein